MNYNKSKSFQGPYIFSIVLSSKSNQYTVDKRLGIRCQCRS
nr:MAG TPA: hypothetical protein [Caudoviricetes sp.]